MKTRYWCFSFLAAVLIVFGGGSPAIASTQLEAYGQLPYIQAMAVSPSGDLFAFRNTTPESDSVFVYSKKEKKLIKRIAVTADTEPSRIQFLTEDEMTFVIAEQARIPGFRGLHEIHQSVAYNLKKNKVRPLLTLGKGSVYPGQTSVDRIIGLSPDRKYVYMLALAGKDSVHAGDYPTNSVFRVKISAPHQNKPQESGNRHTIDFFMDAKGQAFVREDYDNKKNIHTISVRHGRKWREVYRKEVELREISPVGLTSDYKSLVVEGYSTSGSYSLYTMSLEDGTLKESGFSKPDTDIERTILDVNRVFYGVEYSGFTPSYHMLDGALDKRVNEIVAMFKGSSVHIESWSADWKSILVSVEGSEFAGEYYNFTEGEQPFYITSRRPNIKSEAVHPVAKLSFSAEDGFKIPTLLTIPRPSISNINNLPAVMLPHGGPASYDRIGFDWMAQALAEQGYLVIQPQFRGSEGFGWDHYQAGFGQWGKKMQTDLSDVLAGLVKKGYVDADRVCIAGFSYGGYAALMGGGTQSDRYKCVVAGAPVTDLNALLYTKEYNFGPEHWVISYFERSMGKKGKDKSVLKALSPVSHAASFSVPVLLIHGDLDDVVPYKQSKKMFSALKKAGKDVELIKLKNETHHLKFNTTRLEALESMVSFVNKHLKK